MITDLSHTKVWTLEDHRCNTGLAALAKRSSSRGIEDVIVNDDVLVGQLAS